MKQSEIPEQVLTYIADIKAGRVLANRERLDMVEWLERDVLPRDDIHFDRGKINDFEAFCEKWFFKPEPFQLFKVSFVFLFFNADGDVFFDQFLWLEARGAGKNGLLTALGAFLLSPLHGIPGYNISVVANSEEQAKTTPTELYNKVDSEEALQDWFKHTRTAITGRDTASEMKYRTSNANTKDGLRDGAVFYDEIHEFEEFDKLDVFGNGLGKVPHGREFFVGTDGYVREGVLDKMKERAAQVMAGEAPDDGLFPFICKLDNPAEVEDPDNWRKANPQFEPPLSVYGEQLLRKVRRQFNRLEYNPAGREDFLTKRMNLPQESAEKSVASREEIMATNRPIPEQQLRGMKALGGLDFASIRDFVAVGCLFKVGGDYVWKTHSFVRQGFLDKFKPKAPIARWAREGLLTIVDEPVISVGHVVDWFSLMREDYGLEVIVADNFRLDLVKTALEAAGFTLLYIQNPRAIHAKLAPRVETLFAQQRLIWGDNPLMRWYTNNVFVKTDPQGNKTYGKKEELRRKTDGFQAFIYALWQASNQLEQEEETASDLFVDAIEF